MMSSKINNENIIRFIYFKTRLNGFQIVHDREPFKDYLADFARKGGGEPPFPLSFFEHNDCPLRGRGYPPIPLRKKSAKKRLFLAKKN